VIGYGRVLELLTVRDKIHGLEQIMAQYSDQEWGFGPDRLGTIHVWKIQIEGVTGKQSGSKVAL
jgi:hypothetical protein